MGWKGNIIDMPLGLAARVIALRNGPMPKAPSIFVLRNNDIGDLLVTTPLFEALARRFPDSEIVAGVGRWNFPVLENNPFVTDIVEVNAPWNNKNVPGQEWGNVIRYIARSPEITHLAARHFDIGIDVLGSHVGSALLMRLGIPYRLGVRGYRGGHTAAEQFVQYNPAEHVGRSALRFAELLGATELPENRPQLFLSEEERSAGESRWPGRAGGRIRITLGIGGGFREKCWPTQSFANLLDLLREHPTIDIALVGGVGDRSIGAALAVGRPDVHDLSGILSLRETFALTSASDAVVSNPSMLMHVAAAFRKPTVVVLGPYFPSAIEHDAQWGYPGTCRSLGSDSRGGTASPSFAFDTLASLIRMK